MYVDLSFDFRFELSSLIWEYRFQLLADVRKYTAQST